MYDVVTHVFICVTLKAVLVHFYFTLRQVLNLFIIMFQVIYLILFLQEDSVLNKTDKTQFDFAVVNVIKKCLILVTALFFWKLFRSFFIFVAVQDAFEPKL